MRIWNRLAGSTAILWLVAVVAFVVAACGNGGTPGY